jgi:hypothetical protein
MGREPDIIDGRLCDWFGCAASTYPSVSFCPPGRRLLTQQTPNIDFEEMRPLPLIWRAFCQVSVGELSWSACLGVWSAGLVAVRRAVRDARSD